MHYAMNDYGTSDSLVAIQIWRSYRINTSKVVSEARILSPYRPIDVTDRLKPIDI